MKRSIFSVMTDPRGFMRDLPKEKMGTMPLYLAWVIGFVYLLKDAASLQLSMHYSFAMILLIAAVIAIPLAFIGLYIFAFFLFWAGKLFKGKANYKELFSAAAFGRVPEFIVLLCWFLLVMYFGEATFSWKTISAAGSIYISILLFAQTVFYIWGFVISLHTVGEVQKFSAWMSLWNYILAFVLIVLVSLFIQFLVAIVFSLKMYGVDSVSTMISLIR